MKISPTALVALLAMTASGCTTAPETQASAAQQAYCRQRADQIYNRRNPGDVFRTDHYVSGQRDSPFASTGSVGDPMAALGARYERSKILEACLRGASGQSGGAPTAPGGAAIPPVAKP